MPPRDDKDFGPLPYSQDPLFRRRAMSVIGRFNQRGESPLYRWGVNVLSIEVIIEAAGIGPLDGPTEPTAPHRAYEAFQSAGQVAVKLYRSYIDRARTFGRQPWLASSSGWPRLALPTAVRDENGYELSFDFHFGPGQLTTIGYTTITADLYDEMLEFVVGKNSPELADILLADAKYIMWQLNPDLRQALLLTAVACEVKVKDTLLSLATSEQRPLVELLFERPRDFSVAALALFDIGLSSVCGRSLRQDDKSLYTLVKRLFETRNRIAHRVSDDIGNNGVVNHINAATLAFAYLDHVSRGEVWNAPENASTGVKETGHLLPPI